jgi:hypothetical protein
MAFKSKEQIFLDSGLDLNDEKYSSMSQGFRSAHTRFYTNGQTSKMLSDFLAGVKKGSKKFRIIIGKSKTAKSPGRDPILSYARIAELPVPVEKIMVSLNIRWTKNYFSSEMKTILFKLYHNCLGLNAWVHHYNPDRDEACTFCTKLKNLPAERETFIHFFWYCPAVNNILTEFFRNNFWIAIGCREYFLGCREDNDFNESLMLVFDILKYTFWCIKLRKTLPNRHNISNDFKYNLDIALGANKKIKEHFNLCNLFRRHGEQE